MWKIKTFKTQAAMNAFIQANANRIQYSQVFINNKYAIEYRPLRRIA